VATCDPSTGYIDVFRDDDYRDRHEILEIPLWPFDDAIVIYEDDYYDDCDWCW
jgi:hypothetical protein